MGSTRKDSKIIYLRVPPELHAKVQEYAESKGATVTGEVLRLVDNLWGEDDRVTEEEMERAICQGSRHPVLREAASLLWSLGQRARGRAQLTKDWFTSAERALALQAQLGSTTIPTTGSDRLAQLCEPGHSGAIEVDAPEDPPHTNGSQDPAEDE